MLRYADKHDGSWNDDDACVHLDDDCPGWPTVENIALMCNIHDDLVEVLEGVLAGFDAGVFVRNTYGDSDPMWALKALPYIRALATAQAIIPEARDAS